MWPLYVALAVRVLGVAGPCWFRNEIALELGGELGVSLSMVEGTFHSSSSVLHQETETRGLMWLAQVGVWMALVTPVPHPAVPSALGRLHSSLILPHGVEDHVADLFHF
jgi:hypothetical protein